MGSSFLERQSDSTVISHFTHVEFSVAAQLYLNKDERIRVRIRMDGPSISTLDCMKKGRNTNALLVLTCIGINEEQLHRN